MTRTDAAGFDFSFLCRGRTGTTGTPPTAAPVATGPRGDLRGTTGDSAESVGDRPQVSPVDPQVVKEEDPRENGLSPASPRVPRAAETFGSGTSLDARTLFSGDAYELFRLLTVGEDLRLTATRAGLVLGPVGRASTEHHELAAAYAGALERLCEVCGLGVQERIGAFARQYQPFLAAIGVPRFQFREGVPYEPCMCHSCGDDLPPAVRWGTCRRCALAWRIVVGAEISDGWLLDTRHDRGQDDTDEE